MFFCYAKSTMGGFYLNEALKVMLIMLRENLYNEIILGWRMLYYFIIFFRTRCWFSKYSKKTTFFLVICFPMNSWKIVSRKLKKNIKNTQLKCLSSWLFYHFHLFLLRNLFSLSGLSHYFSGSMSFKNKHPKAKNQTKVTIFLFHFRCLHKVNICGLLFTWNRFLASFKKFSIFTFIIMYKLVSIKLQLKVNVNKQLFLATVY